jgi:hypothetical protein
MVLAVLKSSVEEINKDEWTEPVVQFHSYPWCRLVVVQRMLS